MSECPDCDVLRKRVTPQDLYACALCGEKRCADHTVWVPANELEGFGEDEKRVRELLKDGLYSGWYAFCGKGAHVPKGMTIRFGKSREGGKLVKYIPAGLKGRELSFFSRWEVGLIEKSFEKWWDEGHYQLSCSFAEEMEKISGYVTTGQYRDIIMRNIFDKLIQDRASGKSIFDSPSGEEFDSAIGKSPTILDFAAFICSRCHIVACLNRKGEFHDQKKFKKLIKNSVL